MTGNSLREEGIRRVQTPKSLEEVQAYALGEWVSLSVELRPNEDRTGSGRITPNFLTRQFSFLSSEHFVGVITLFADNYGHMPLMEFEFNSIGRRIFAGLLPCRSHLRKRPGQSTNKQTGHQELC